jgi:hypothetical protein
VTTSNNPTAWSVAPTLSAYDFTTIYEPAYEGQTWTEAVDILLSHPADVATIEMLRDAAKNGTLNNPVVVTQDSDTGRWLVGDGMHRVTACLLENQPIAYTTDWPEADPLFLNYSVTITSPHTSDDQTVRDDNLDNVFSWLRSFPAGGTWVDTSVLGSSENPDGTFTMTAWYVGPPGLTPFIEQIVRTKCEQAGIPVHSLIVEIVPDEE